MSLDARTAAAGRGTMWISGEASRADVQHWRARSSAVLTGAGTVRADDPRLDVRLTYGSWVRQPLKVLLDPALSCPPGARLFTGAASLVFAAEAAPESAALAAHQPPVTVERVPASSDGRLDLDAVIARLTALEVNELLVECGPRLAASFLAARRVDELIVYVAPILLGADAPPLTAMTGAEAEGSAAAFDIGSVERIGADLRLILTPRASGQPGAASGGT
jgi:diaminohydroxyphosphoribosylaminopyrimidine deaminase / 5-amino-6-(5-phosphoribosylamino)uracil reductase